MNIYIFEGVDHVSSNYHSNGGLVVIARDVDHVLELIATDDAIILTADDIARCKVYPLEGDHTAQIFVFPDAGCC